MSDVCYETKNYLEQKLNYWVERFVVAIKPYDDILANRDEYIQAHCNPPISLQKPQCCGLGNAYFDEIQALRDSHYEAYGIAVTNAQNTIFAIDCDNREWHAKVIEAQAALLHLSEVVSNTFANHLAIATQLTVLINECGPVITPGDG